MKKISCFLLAGSILLLIPLIPALSSSNSTPLPSAASSAQTEHFRMLDVSSGEVLEISARDYLIGAVFAEMPATFEPDALMAQAVAVHTYAMRQQRMEQESPTPSLYGADFSNDSSTYLAYFTESQARQFYTDGYDTAYAKISTAVDTVLPYTLQYDGEPIVAAFCSMSAGKTECAENVWGSAAPYLTVVDSAADVNAPNFEQVTAFSPMELQEKLTKAVPEGTFSDNRENWLCDAVYSESGTVLNIMAGGVKTDGQTIREVLGLRSAAFTVEWTGEVFQITTKGYGHGVGMSQYGANAMAQQGADWKTILAHYYPETTLAVG